MRDLISTTVSEQDLVPDADPKAVAVAGQSQWRWPVGWLCWLSVLASSVLWGGRVLACRLVLLAALGLCKLVLLLSLWGRQLSLIARRLRVGQRFALHTSTEIFPVSALVCFVVFTLQCSFTYFRCLWTLRVGSLWTLYTVLCTLCTV